MSGSIATVKDGGNKWRQGLSKQHRTEQMEEKNRQPKGIEGENKTVEGDIEKRKNNTVGIGPSKVAEERRAELSLRSLVWEPNHYFNINFTCRVRLTKMLSFIGE